MARAPKLPTALSPSSIDLWTQCPKRYEEEKIKGMYSPPGEAAVKGTFVHLILEKLMEQPPEERTVETAKALAREEAWPEISASKDYLSLHLSERAAHAFRWEAWASVENYFKMQDPTTIDVVATEQNLNIEVGGVPLRGIVDRLDREDGKLVVVDYKNGKVPDAKYAGPKKEQLNIYASMIEARDGELPASGLLVFTAHSEFIKVDFTPASVAKVVTKAQKIWYAIHENFAFSYGAAQGEPKGQSTFQAKTSPLCGWCPALSKCPEGMAAMTMAYRQGRLKSTAPGYDIIANGGPKPTTQIVHMPKRRR